MGEAVDELLIGHWSSLAFSYGVMEAVDLGFLGSGRGWSAWYNAYSLCVTRFRWSCPEPGVLQLHAQWLIEGTLAAPPGRPAFATPQGPAAVDEITRHRYTIGHARPIPGAEALPALVFQEHIDSANIFERGPLEIAPEDDPSHYVLLTRKAADH
jgi:hypothetical protein